MTDDVPAAPHARAADRQLVELLAQRALEGDSGQSRDADAPQPTESFAALQRRDLQQDIKLKKTYATATLVGVGVQLLIADVAFFWYLADDDAARRVPPVVMDFWLSATVVEVIGVILVITNYLFPNRGRGDKSQPGDPERD